MKLNHGPRVRVEAKKLPPNPTRQEREKSCIQLQRAFKRACNEYGIMHSIKEHEFFIRKTDKNRRKKMLKKQGQLMADLQKNMENRDREEQQIY
jgi:ribosomal protein S21